MIPELENLITLQKLDLQIRAIETRLARIPVEVEELEKEIATERANVKAVEDRLSELQKQRRAMEGELEQIETLLGKYKDASQLMQVKKNDEYKAMEKQIGNTKEEIGKKEEDILIGMEESDRFQEQLKLRQKELEEGQKKVSAMEADLEAEATRLRTELEKENSDREKLLATIDADLLAQYRARPTPSFWCRHSRWDCHVDQSAPAGVRWWRTGRRALEESHSRSSFCWSGVRSCSA